jgi:phage terminase large subunit
MLYQPTTAIRKLLQLKKRIKGIAGGTAASKTIGIIQILIDKAQRDKEPTLTSITSESMPHLKRGAIRDFLSIMQGHNYFQDARWNKSDFIYTFETGSKIEFFSLDMPHKVRGPRRDRLFINEANNIPLETFEQLEVRTKDEIWLDWNPTHEFWFYTEILNNPNFKEAMDFLILTYKDNEGLDRQVVETIERRKGNKNWWKVYGLGQLGELEGKIYTGWRIIDEVPEEARLERYGLDFGYSNDPAAIVGVHYLNGEYILDEITYQKGLHNKDLADIIKNLPPALTIADSAEPKSIDEIRSYGVNIIGVKKQQVNYGGKKSFLNWSIDQVQSQKIAMTKRSVNLIKEYRNYLWQTDKDGKIITTPEPGNDHILDATRYAIVSLVPLIRRVDYINSLPHIFQHEKPANPAR